MTLLAIIGAFANDSVSSFNCVWNFCGPGHIQVKDWDGEMDTKLANLEKYLHLCVSHFTRSRSHIFPPLLAAEIACPELCLDIGVVSGDGKDERRSAKHKLQ